MVQIGIVGGKGRHTGFTAKSALVAVSGTRKLRRVDPEIALFTGLVRHFQLFPGLSNVKMGRKKSRFYNGTVVGLPYIGPNPSCADPERKREIVNTNVSMLVPGEACSVPESLLKVAPSAPTISSRRQKLMDNYISKKLKKDARPLLMERLQNAAYLGEGLQSTKKLLLPVIPLCKH